MPKSSKRSKLIDSKVDRDKLHNLDEAIDLIKSVKATKFDETVAVSYTHLTLTTNPYV